jgi:predicted mannosyl-3-phosphoglycerate phosphatase (HAD superfamily)
MENEMSAESVCTNLKLELNAWKENVSKIAEKFESQPGHAKAGVLENIEDIHILVHDLQNRIDQLEETCSLNGFDDVRKQQEIDKRYQVNLRDADSAVSAISGGNFGG